MFAIESFRSGGRRRGLDSPVAIGDTAPSPKAVGSAPSTTGDHARAPASKERRQETANSHPAMAGGQGREDARSGPSRRRGRRQDHGAEASARNAVAGDGRLFQEMRREARLRAERAQGLRVRRRQAQGVRGLPAAASAECRKPVQARNRNDRDGGIVAEPLLLLHHPRTATPCASSAIPCSGK